LGERGIKEERVELNKIRLDYRLSGTDKSIERNGGKLLIKLKKDPSES
jgi:hypothetical protein